MGAAASSVSSASSAASSAVRSSVAPDPDLELVLTTVDQLQPVVDTGGKRRVRLGLADFRQLYLATFVQGSRVSVFELYDCLISVARAFFKLYYDCDWAPEDANTITHLRNLSLQRLQACVDEAIARTGTVDPRPTVADPVAHEQYMRLTRAWPRSAPAPPAP